MGGGGGTGFHSVCCGEFNAPVDYCLSLALRVYRVAESCGQEHKGSRCV